MAFPAVVAAGTAFKAFAATWFGQVVISMAISAALSWLTRSEYKSAKPNIDFTGSNYGTALQKGFGICHSTSSQIIWAAPMEYRDDDVGGKGGGGAEVTYAVATFALAFATGPIRKVRKIWLDEKLKYDITSTDPGVIQETANFASKINIHLGTEDQGLDSIIQARTTDDSTLTAHRGIAYIVFERLTLKYNRMYSIKVEYESYPSDIAITSTVMSSQLWGKLPDYPTAIDNVVSIAFSNNQVEVGYVYNQGTDWEQYVLQTNTITYENSNVGAATLPVKIASNLVSFETVLASDSTGFDTLYPQSGSTAQAVHMFDDGEPFPTYEDRFFSYFDYRISDSLNLTEFPINHPTFWTSTSFKSNVVFSLAEKVGTLFTYDYARFAVLSTIPGPADYLVKIPYSNYVDPASDPDWPSGIDINYEIYSGTPTNNYHLLFSDQISTFIVLVSSATKGGEGTLHVVTKQTMTAVTTEVTYQATLGVSKVAAVNKNYIICINSTNDKFKVYDENLTLINELDYGNETVLNDQFFYPPTSSGNFFNYCNNIYTFEDGSGGPYAYGGYLLSDVVKSICVNAGLSESQVDVTGLTDYVWSFFVNEKITARGLIEQLRQVYFFDTYELNGKIYFQQLGQALETIIPQCDFVSDLEVEKTLDQELPKRVEIDYRNMEKDLEPALVRAERQLTTSEKDNGVNVPIGFYREKGQSIADKALAHAWRSRHLFKFTLPHFYHTLNPSDVRVIEYDDKQYPAIIKKKNYTPNGQIDFEAQSYGADVFSDEIYDANYIPLAPGEIDEDGNIGNPGINVGENTFTVAYVADIAALNEADNYPGIYIFGSQPGKIYISRDQVNYSLVGELEEASNIGFMNSNMPANARIQWDTASEVLVECSKPLSSATETETLLGKNLAAIIHNDHTLEVFRYQTATIVDSTHYKLSGLLRGVLGTENFIYTNVVGNKVVFLDATLAVDKSRARVSLQAIDQNQLLGFKLVPVTQTLEDTPVTPYETKRLGVSTFAPYIYRVGTYGAAGQPYRRAYYTHRARLANYWANTDPDTITGDLGKYYYQLQNVSDVWERDTVTTVGLAQPEFFDFQISLYTTPCYDNIKLGQYGLINPVCFTTKQIFPTC